MEHVDKRTECKTGSSPFPVPPGGSHRTQHNLFELHEEAISIRSFLNRIHSLFFSFTATKNKIQWHADLKHKRQMCFNIRDIGRRLVCNLMMDIVGFTVELGVSTVTRRSDSDRII